ncbi:hypothetical protein BDP55DRAFT_627863 [Colletotrichum godetiae]|uniref:Uncharacterized protein n=1 Tax=Colletotrichum godetiae TaxID=1209918 RepID=A0AAJ0ATQ1_9PEZI|nr:uncharacterized protein BDP55DRAFT_627863 [Colletotrichum godetiae]KAK1690165.1 hypothetical protein BDP55DRAFT_627863 [Colletotrichum godetiae]
MRRKKLTEGLLYYELAYQLRLQDARRSKIDLNAQTASSNSDHSLPPLCLQTRSPDNHTTSSKVPTFSSLTFAVLLCAASGTLAQNQPKDKYKCYVPFDTCSKPIPAELKASMAKEFGARSECRLTEVVYYGAPDAAIEGVYCEPGPVRSMGGLFQYSVGRVSTVCHSKCEIWG